MNLIMVISTDLCVHVPYIYMSNCMHICIYTSMYMHTLTFHTILFFVLAVKEFAFMKALHAHGFPTPTPIDQSRHIVAMSKIEGEE